MGRRHPAVHERPVRRNAEVVDVWSTAVTTVIAQMHERLGEPQTLRDLARSALMSPFHFHRVFRAVTAATPGQFLTALRMARARTLLLETDMSATDIGMTVGYSSFGTFTTQFTKLVGLAPGRFRAMARAVGDEPAVDVIDVGLAGAASLRRGPRGWITPRPDGEPGVALVGLFPSRIPQRLPRACALVRPPGAVRLPEVESPGEYEVLAISFAEKATVRELLTASPSAGIYVGLAEQPVQVGGPSVSPFWIRLRSLCLTDPPPLVAFPFIAAAPLAAS